VAVSLAELAGLVTIPARRPIKQGLKKTSGRKIMSIITSKSWPLRALFGLTALGFSMAAAGQALAADPL
jgi:hypothetical protein